jgi:hypothetical protein
VEFSTTGKAPPYHGARTNQWLVNCGFLRVKIKIGESPLSGYLSLDIT